MGKSGGKSSRIKIGVCRHFLQRARKAGRRGKGRQKSGFYPPHLRASSTASEVARQDARREGVLSHAGVPRRSRSHAPPPALASVHMNPVLLRPGPAGERRAAEWALSVPWVGKKCWVLLLQNAGAGAWRVGGRAAISRLNMRLRRPTSPVHRGRAFFCTQAAGGWHAVGSGQLAPLHLLHSPCLHSNKRCSFSLTDYSPTAGPCSYKPLAMINT